MFPAPSQTTPNSEVQPTTEMNKAKGVAWSVVSSAAVPLDFLLYIVVSLRSE
jgi:hypothetical protein